MNFRRNKAFSRAIIICLALGIGLAIFLYGTGNHPKMNITTVLPTVSADAGVAPIIGNPAGTAPAKLVSKDIIRGTGQTALSSSTITAQYVLMDWKTGKTLQSSWSSGPFTAPLSGVIVGWQQGIPGMRVGGRRLLVIPPALAYPNGGGPAGTLLFVVDLLGVK